MARFLEFVELPAVGSKTAQVEAAADQTQHFSIAAEAGRDSGTVAGTGSSASVG